MKYFFYFAEVILIGVLNNYYGLFALRAAFFFFTAIQPGFFSPGYSQLVLEKQFILR